MTQDDFKVGAALCVFGRELLVVDTDAFTKKWYIENRGKTEQDFVALSVPKIVKQLPKREIPPYNGYCDTACLYSHHHSLKACSSDPLCSV